MKENKTFHIGLCMAGAISAGAYTAGVVDYLLETLEAWQKRKDTGAPNTPKHDVKISVIGGASAGGMTGIITAAMLQDEWHPVRRLGKDIYEPQPYNRLYHSWVDLTHNDMFPRLLKTDDVKKSGQVSALLNSDFIDEIANRALRVDPDKLTRKAYIDENLKLFVTLSNLRGYGFDIAFNSNIGKNNYRIANHKDYAMFQMSNSDAQLSDGWIPLNFAKNINVQKAREAAMATGAFPVGLKARRFTRKLDEVNDSEWLKDYDEVGEDYLNALMVDGGLINNEPFDKVREVLLQNSGEALDSESFNDVSRSKSTILMVDPFPTKDQDFEDGDSLARVAGNTLSAMIGHLRTKSAALKQAMDAKMFGQFLIAPQSRFSINGEEYTNTGSDAIACGTLGGFGGFLSKEFRIHDFFQGRANCEKFLRHHFVIPDSAGNAIFDEGYAGVENREDFSVMKDGELCMQVVPVFTPEAKSRYIPEFKNHPRWPVISEREIDKLKKPLKKRNRAILLNMAKLSRTQRVLLWIGAKVLIDKKISSSVLTAIKKSLETYRLLGK